MVSIMMVAILDIVIMGEDMEPIKTTTELNSQELKYLFDNGSIKRNPDQILIDLENGIFLGKDILNIKELAIQIEKEIAKMQFIYDTVANIEGVDASQGRVDVE